jgi:hypothetical protein
MKGRKKINTEQKWIKGENLKKKKNKKIPGQSMWDLWWTKRHWDRFLPEYFGFPLSISFHRCSITLKNEKKNIIFHLHHKVAQEALRLRCVRSFC